MRRILAIALSVLLVAMLAAGCGGEPPKEPTHSTGSPTSASDSSTVTDAPVTDTTVTDTTVTTAATTSTATTKKTTATTKKTTSRTTSRSTAAKTTTSATTTATTTTTTNTTTTTTTTTTATTTTVTTARPEVTVTIPEGYTFMQIARLLEQKGVCTAAEFYEVSQNYTPSSFSIPISDDRCFRMEGYLFPDTYRFYVDDDPQAVLVRMLNNYKAKVGDISDDTLILASIIEREARSDTHMKLVSSVFHNRLNNRKDFPYLNADPTRDYVNAYITGNPLVKDQSKYAPLYNTCNKRRGLPAGPICNPGLRAIRAAEEPAESSYYYFFYGKDGDNHYSVTLEEHEQKMAEIGVG